MRKRWASALVLIAVLVGVPRLLWAACTGSSPNLTAPTFADLAACHTAASNGDTITVTPGSYTVSSSDEVSITKYVKVILAGVTLTDNTPNGDNLFTITESTAGSTELRGGAYVQGTTRHASPAGTIQVNTGGASGKPVVLRDFTYSAPASFGNFLYFTVNRGVIYNATGTGTPQGNNCNNTTSFIRIKPGLDGTWETPATFGDADTGGDKHLYMDSVSVINMGEGVDLDNNARVVFRFGTLQTWGVGIHGDTSPGGRYAEIYKSTWSADNTLQANCASGTLIPNAGELFTARAATALIMANTINTVDTDGYWGGVRGSFALFGYQLRRNCWTGGYPAPRQVGWGYTTGGTVLDTTSLGTYPNPESQDLQPIYIAGNTGAASTDVPGVANYDCSANDACFFPDTASCQALDSAATYIVANREFYSQAGGVQTNSTTPFSGATGTGYGTRANRPTTCTAGVTYWATDQGSWNTSGSGGQGVLDKCTSTNTWTNAWYTPYAYPHPLTADVSATVPLVIRMVR